jgi:hypothetical protein
VHAALGSDKGGIVSNASVLARLLRLTDLLNEKGISVEQFEKEAQSHISAIEGISSADIDRSREFEKRIARAIYEKEYGWQESPDSVIHEYQSWLQNLIASQERSHEEK